MANQWFRLYSEFAFDPKVQMLSESDQRRLVMLFCLRSCNANVTLQDKHVTFQLRISDDEWAVTKAVFVDNGFIDSENNVLNWEKRQYVSDSSAERVARHREKVRNANVTTCNVTVTAPDTEQIQIQNKEKKQTKPRADGADVFPEISDRQLVEDWLKVRKAKKLPVTPTALEGFMREVSKSGISLEAVLRRCCEKGWGGFEAKWLQHDYGPARKVEKFDPVAYVNRFAKKPGEYDEKVIEH
jgi:hypothetical protein